MKESDYEIDDAPDEVRGVEITLCSDRSWSKGAVADVLRERDRQVTKWGVYQVHQPEIWAAILGEEYGELCKAMLHLRFNSPDNELLDNMKKEAVHTAAVALAIVEGVNRYFGKED